MLDGVAHVRGPQGLLAVHIPNKAKQRERERERERGHVLVGICVLALHGEHRCGFGSLGSEWPSSHGVLPRTGTATSWSLVCSEDCLSGRLWRVLEVFLHCDYLVPAGVGLCVLGLLLDSAQLNWVLDHEACTLFMLPAWLWFPKQDLGQLVRAVAFPSAHVHGIARKGLMKRRRGATSVLVVKLKKMRGDEIFGSGAFRWILPPEQSSRGSVDAGVPKPTR